MSGMLVRSGLMTLAMLTIAAAPAVRAQDDPDDVFGTYEYVSGKDASGEMSKDRLKGSVKVTEDRVLLIGEDGAELFSISYTIDAEEVPYKFTMKIEKSVMEDTVGATAKGLSKHEDGKITLIYDPSEGAGHPNDFEPEGQQRLIVLAKKAAAK